MQVQMVIHEVEFVGSFPDQRICPKAKIPEYAFIGRSNVGKSSLINQVMGRKDLAHVSKKPGKTQTLNYYLVNKQWNLVDLPGYGYAVTAKYNRKAWKKMIYNYLEKREQLMCTFLLLDGNIPFQSIDEEFMNWLGERGVPFVIVYTKVDKTKEKEIPEKLEQIETAILKHWESLPQRFITSARDAQGIEEIRQFITQVNEKFNKRRY